MKTDSLTRKILVIDDSAEDRDGFKAALLRGSTDRFLFLEAETCSEGLRIFNREGAGSFHCLIIDFSLPDGDATDILGALPTSTGVKDVPVLVLTGSGPDTNREVLRAGAHEYLGKSWMTPASISRAIENAVDRHAMARQLADSLVQLKESEQLSRSVIDSSPDCVKVLDEQGRLLNVNPIGMKLLEMEDFSLFANKQWAECWPEQGRQMVKDALEAAAKGGVGRFQGFCPTVQGRPKFWDVIVSPLQGASARRFLAVSRDITSIKQSEALLRESEERFRNMAQHMPAIMCVIEPDGQCSFLNNEWSKITGQTQADGEGSGWLQTIHTEDRPKVADALQRGLVNQNAFNIKCRVKKQNSDFIWILLVLSPRFADSAFVGFVGSAVDLTDQRILEELVSERTAELQETIGELESVSYSISHDMRQPLRSMQQFSQIVLEDYAPQLDPKAATYLKRIVTASNRLDHLIQDVLTYSRVSRTTDVLRPIDLTAMVLDIVSQYPMFHQPGISIEVVGPLLPVIAHDALLTQIISNLLGNAVKFRRPQGSLNVTVRTELHGAFVRLWVIDNGIGIKPDNIERIWKIFECVHETKDIEGTGVGLSIVKRAAERMHGKSGVESELGHGSRFWVTLQPAPSSN